MLDMIWTDTLEGLTESLHVLVTSKGLFPSNFSNPG